MRARREVVLTTPYFVPEDALVTALRGAAARGVRVVVILPQTIDSLLVRYASRSFFDEVISSWAARSTSSAAGCCTPSRSPSTANVAMFGTANFDMRSLWLNYEVSLLVYDEGFARDLRALQQSYLDERRTRSCWSPGASGRWARGCSSSTMRLMSPCSESLIRARNRTRESGKAFVAKDCKRHLHKFDRYARKYRYAIFIGLR